MCRNCSFLSNNVGILTGNDAFNQTLCENCRAKLNMQTGCYEKAPEEYCELTKKIYDKFVLGYKIVQCKFLNAKLEKQVFDILKNNMCQIGFDVTENDYKVWSQNIRQNLKSNQNHMAIIYKDGKVCGYIYLCISNNKATISEIELAQNVQHTRALLYALKYIAGLDAINKLEGVYFNINNSNHKSIKTFTHLGAEMIEQKQNSSKYFLKKSNALDVITRLTRR